MVVHAYKVRAYTGKLDLSTPSTRDGFGDMLPWADPYIVRLVRRHEIAEFLEQQPKKRSRRTGRIRAELPPPVGDTTHQGDDLWRSRHSKPR